MRWQGRLVKGMGVAAQFMQLPWVVREMEQKLGYKPFPGTLNVEIDHVNNLHEYLKNQEPILLEPPAGSGFCQAWLYPVLIMPVHIHGAILRPDIELYPPAKVELVAKCDLSAYQDVQLGSPIEFEWPLPSENQKLL